MFEMDQELQFPDEFVAVPFPPWLFIQDTFAMPLSSVDVPASVMLF
jgi:hypothetical protein